MAASLRGGGTIPEVREEFMTAMMRGVRGVRQSLMSLDGMGSRGEVEKVVVESILKSSNEVMGEKLDSWTADDEESEGSGSGVVVVELVMDGFYFGVEK